MVVVMEERATESQIEKVVASLVEAGMDVHRSTGVNRTVLGVVGAHKVDPDLISVMGALLLLPILRDGWPPWKAPATPLRKRW